jgi:hypothetical protein
MTQGKSRYTMISIDNPTLKVKAMALENYSKYPEG